MSVGGSGCQRSPTHTHTRTRMHVLTGSTPTAHRRSAHTKKECARIPGASPATNHARTTTRILTMCKFGARFHHVPATADRCAQKKEGHLGGSKGRATCVLPGDRPRPGNRRYAAQDAMASLRWPARGARRPSGGMQRRGEQRRRGCYQCN